MDPKKKCIKCFIQKKAHDFYKTPSGNPENTCKECKKTLRRKKYLTDKKTDELSRLADFVHAMLEIESERIDKINRKLEARLLEIEKKNPSGLAA